MNVTGHRQYTMSLPKQVWGGGGGGGEKRRGEGRGGREVQGNLSTTDALGMG